MAQKLNTTVVLGDAETGESRTLTPDSKLSSGDLDELRERWGAQFDRFVEDVAEEEDEDRVAGGPLPTDKLRADLPQPDRIPDESLSEADEPASVKQGQARVEESTAEANDSESGKTGQGGTATGSPSSAAATKAAAAKSK